MVKREIEASIQKKLYQKKAIILLGARQTGKTTLLQQIKQKSEKTLWLNADEPEVQAIFENPSSARLKSIFKGKKLLIIDEAQRIKNIGIKLKLITDSVKDIQVIATGSSAFELANEINEPLTGRKWEFQLFPFSFSEMTHHHGFLAEQSLLPQRLIYGYYPEVVNHPGQEIAILKSLTDSYLYKDILMWEQIKKPDKLLKLMQALAFQVGQQVSFNELGQLTGLNNETVERYIQLLEKTFILFRLNSFSRNLRNELKQSKKIYFYDNGIRNALIANFLPIELRQDVGMLWENFMISEKIKEINYHPIFANLFFWRTHEQQEIDLIIEKNGTLSAYEFKWNPKKKARIPATFIKNYPKSNHLVVTPENFEQFLNV